MHVHIHDRQRPSRRIGILRSSERWHSHKEADRQQQPPHQASHARILANRRPPRREKSRRVS
jgi:hypothetical protein